jgi:uncharacterized protein (TIGR03067 family)
MRRITNLICVFATTGALAAPPVKPKPNPLIGVWTRVSIAYPDGTTNDKHVRWEFTADGRRVIPRDGLRTEHRYAADPGVTPMAIEITLDGGAQHGVYKVDGDTLTIALSDKGDPRPTGFTTPPHDGATVSVFRRVKPKE